MLEALDELKADGLAGIETVADTEALEMWRIRFLGAKGRLKAIMPRIKGVPPAQRPEVGRRLNAVKRSLQSAYERKSAEVAAGAAAGAEIDVTEPGIPVGLGRRHIITRTIDEIVEVFGRMGFCVASGPEVEDEWHNFDALNIGPDHPAREPSDNFYLAGGLMLRSQTSTVQIRTMALTKPPLRVVAIGRVYRPDTHDATHYSMFHQVEGLYVDEGVTMVDLKTTLFQFARAYLGPEAEVRMRPSFFPFTEPSAEVDMKMKVKGRYQWVEMGGCGMVDPNVFEAVGYDPEHWTGFAFGLGIERIAMRKYGIADIRWLFENDARFLRQF
ncbi:MAG: phenylalanine--tRNA ligase subunit alpha [Planctomycetes bacterium]|nr:phenylalanine--tRNA ligase subunit alpha [Planctomycetota bacterium]